MYTKPSSQTPHPKKFMNPYLVPEEKKKNSQIRQVRHGWVCVNKNL